MNTYAADKDVIVPVPMLDDSGNAMSVAAVTWRVVDMAGTVLSSWVDLTPFSTDDSEADITVPASLNALSGTARALRVVQFQLTVDGNTIERTVSYAIQSGTPMTVGLDTFQTLEEADFNAALIPNIDAWNAATATAKVNALIEARNHLCMLQYRNRINFWSQDHLMPELIYGDLTMLPVSMFGQLPAEFLKALKRAQIYEANAVLGGEPAEDKRQQGVQLDTVGESKTLFRNEVPLRLPVCRRAIQTMAAWISFNKKITRS